VFLIPITVGAEKSVLSGDWIFSVVLELIGVATGKLTFGFSSAEVGSFSGYDSHEKKGFLGW
jgi:hypothetical protein